MRPLNFIQAIKLPPPVKLPLKLMVLIWVVFAAVLSLQWFNMKAEYKSLVMQEIQLDLQQKSWTERVDKKTKEIREQNKAKKSLEAEKKAFNALQAQVLDYQYLYASRSGLVPYFKALSAAVTTGVTVSSFTFHVRQWQVMIKGRALSMLALSNFFEALKKSYIGRDKNLKMQVISDAVDKKNDQPSQLTFEIGNGFTKKTA